MVPKVLQVQAIIAKVINFFTETFSIEVKTDYYMSFNGTYLVNNNFFFTLTSLRIVGIKVPEAVFATIATTSVNICFTVTTSGLVTT